MPRRSKRRSASKSDTTGDALFEAIEAQRTELRRAVSVLAAMRFALLYHDWIDDETNLDFADLAGLAHELTLSAMNNLDTAKLPKLMPPAPTS